MELFKFTSSGEPTIFTRGTIINNVKTIMWTERYREPGEFELVAPVSSGLREFLPIGTFISHIDTYEVMVVENHEISEENNEDPLITVTGRSLETILENRIVGMNLVRAEPSILEYFLEEDYSWNHAVLLINDHIGHGVFSDDNFENIVATTNITELGLLESRAIKRVDLHKALMELLEAEDLGIKTIRRNTFGVADGSSTQTNLCVHRGRNRSKRVIFSWKAGDLETAEYLWSNKKLKNSAAVIGRYINVAVDTAGETKFDRRTMVVNADDIDGSLDTVPVDPERADIIAKMEARGRDALRTQRSITISRTDLSNVSKYKYRRDFDLGDYVALDGNFGQIAIMRIIEFVEIQDENGETGHPTLSLPPGNVPKPT